MECLVFPLTLLIMDVRFVRLSSLWIASGPFVTPGNPEG
jgi:hypothetical protein